MSFRALYERRVTDPADLDAIILFHDADFVADEITFDQTQAVVEIVFDQDVRYLPENLPLPQLRDQRRHWIGSSAVVPFVECRLVVRNARGFTLTGDDVKWGILGTARFDAEESRLVLDSGVGPDIVIPVEELDVSVAISNRTRAFRRLRKRGPVESMSARLPQQSD